MHEQDSITARLMDKIEIIPFSGCWIWTGATRRNGYGAVKVNRKTAYAHRIAHQIWIGPIPEGHQVMHRCDVTCCINPHHLSIGTNFDNVKDRNAKSRQARGEKMGSAKLSQDQVLAIRADQRSNNVIANDYGVWPGTISHIKTGKTWKHLQFNQPK